MPPSIKVSRYNRTGSFNLRNAGYSNLEDFLDAAKVNFRFEIGRLLQNHGHLSIQICFRGSYTTYCQVGSEPERYIQPFSLRNYRKTINDRSNLNSFSNYIKSFVKYSVEDYLISKNGRELYEIKDLKICVNE